MNNMKNLKMPNNGLQVTRKGGRKKLVANPQASLRPPFLAPEALR